MFNLHGQKYVVFGVANKNSICWEIAKQLHECGGEVVISCLEMMRKRVDPLAAKLGIEHVFSCDVEDETSIEECFAQLEPLAPFYGMVHGIAFSDKDELKGRLVDMSRENFDKTMLVSSYSLIELARRMEPLMPFGGSIVTLSFDASRRTYPNYNGMAAAKAALEAFARGLATDLGENNIRVNTIMASPEDTLSARGISNFRFIGDFAEAKSPMSRRATLEEIAWTAAFLLSPQGSGITGDEIFVDAGSHVTDMPPARNAGLMSNNMAAIDEIVNAQKKGG